MEAQPDTILADNQGNIRCKKYYLQISIKIWSNMHARIVLMAYEISTCSSGRQREYRGNPRGDERAQIEDDLFRNSIRGKNSGNRNNYKMSDDRVRGSRKDKENYNIIDSMLGRSKGNADDAQVNIIILNILACFKFLI